MQLIIATPSPYARKARVALLEKGIAFETIVDNPWLPQTQVAAHNPLAKIPILVLDDGRVLHDSKVIVEYVDSLNDTPRLIPQDVAQRIAHKQIEALADGVCDAVVLSVLETARAPAQQSTDWIARQRAKIAAGVDECERLLGERECFVAQRFGLADIAVACMLGYLDLRAPQIDWRSVHPRLTAWFARVAQRPAFVQSVPSAQSLPTL